MDTTNDGQLSANDAIYARISFNTAKRGIELDDFMAREQMTDAWRRIERLRDTDFSGISQ